MQAILTTVALTLFAASFASAAPCTPQIIFGPAHESLEGAALGALTPLLSAGNRYESGGFVVERNGTFRASNPVTQRSRSDVNYCIVLPRGAKLAGLYHTHVASSAFSARDRRNAERASVPSYIGTIRDRSLFVYDPRQQMARAIDVQPSDASATLAARAAERASSTWLAWKKQLWTVVQKAFDKIAG